MNERSEGAVRLRWELEDLVQKYGKKAIRKVLAGITEVFEGEEDDPITLAQGEKWIRRHFKQGGK